MMILVFVGSALLAAQSVPIAAADSKIGASAAAAQSPSSQQKSEDPYTKCYFDKLSKLEGIDARNAKSFSKNLAKSALADCQSEKQKWAFDLNDQLKTDPKFSNDVLRNAEINKTVSTTELSIIMSIYLLGK